MKKLTGKDYVTVAILLIMMAVLSFGAGKGKGKKVPKDERHQTIYDGLKNGRTIPETELVCATCHGQSSLPLPKNHPPKEQCLICHLLR